MNPTEASQRAAVVAEARTWLGTPYHHRGRLKRAGVDCLMLLAEVYPAAGVVAPVAVPGYPPDWFHHRDAERYMLGLLAHAAEIPGPPGPGDVVLYRFGRCFSHGAIVVAWPVIIHAYYGKGCSLEDAEAASYLTHIGERVEEHGRPRPRKFFSPWSRP